MILSNAPSAVYRFFTDRGVNICMNKDHTVTVSRRKTDFSDVHAVHKFAVFTPWRALNTREISNFIWGFCVSNVLNTGAYLQFSRSGSQETSFWYRISYVSSQSISPSEAVKCMGWVKWRFLEFPSRYLRNGRRRPRLPLTTNAHGLPIRLVPVSITMNNLELTLAHNFNYMWRALKAAV